MAKSETFQIQYRESRISARAFVEGVEKDEAMIKVVKQLDEVSDQTSKAMWEEVVSIGQKSCDDVLQSMGADIQGVELKFADVEASFEALAL